MEENMGFVQRIKKGGWPDLRRNRLYQEFLCSAESERENVGEELTDDIDEYGIRHPLLKPSTICFVHEKSLSAYNITQRGKSHIELGVRCQDRSGIRILSKKGIVISAIADGVGSCALSDIGADCAVNTSLDSLEAQLEQIEMPLTGNIMGKLLRIAMNEAYDSVKTKADELEVLMYALQSTLTIGVYDGDVLYVAHAGDDGVVALLQDGRYCMVTVRHKGDIESSVYPLQSKSTWQFGMTKNVVAYVMCTDGVLDGFVRNRYENERIYYPFIMSDFEGVLKSEIDVKNACEERSRILASEEYRNLVTDDLTYLAVKNNKHIEDMSKFPEFDKQKWEDDTVKYTNEREQALSSIF